jgi:MFS family permease
MSPPDHGGLRVVLRLPEVRAVVIGSFVIMLGFGILAPVLPLYARTFHVDYRAVGELTAAFAFTRLLFDIVAGRMVQRWGERSMATLGSVVLGVSTAFAALAPTFGLLVISRAAGGVGSALFFAALFSYLLRTVPGEQMGRAMSVYYGSFNLGFIVGPPLGGFIANAFGLRSPLWVYAGTCMIAAGLYFRFIRRLERRAAPEDGHRGAIRRLPWKLPLVTVMVVEFATLWVVGAIYLTLLSLFGQDLLGMGELGVSVGIAIASATEFLVLFPAGSAADRLGRKRLLTVGLLLVAVGLPLFSTVSSPVGYMVGLGLLGITTGIGGVTPAAMLSDVVPVDLSATAAGVFRFVGDLGITVGPIVAGWTANTLGLRWAVALTAVPCAVAFGFAIVTPETLGMRVRAEAAAA